MNTQQFCTRIFNLAQSVPIYLKYFTRSYRRLTSQLSLARLTNTITTQLCEIKQTVFLHWVRVWLARLNIKLALSFLPPNSTFTYFTSRTVHIIEGTKLFLTLFRIAFYSCLLCTHTHNLYIINYCLSIIIIIIIIIIALSIIIFLSINILIS